MNDFGNGWDVLDGAPLLVDGWAGKERIQKISNKVTKDCHLVIEGPNLVVSDKKGKKVHLSIPLAGVTTAEEQTLTFFGQNNVMDFPKKMTKYFAVVLLDDGKDFSFLFPKDSSNSHPKQLVATIQRSK
jgi:hypothetical protein